MEQKSDPEAPSPKGLGFRDLNANDDNYFQLRLNVDS